MGDKKVNWKKEEPKKIGEGHPDYKTNLDKSYHFINATEKSWPEFMRVYVTNSEGLQKSLLMISFSPPPFSGMGNYATPIFLHQPTEEVAKKIEYHFNSYMKMANKFLESRKVVAQILPETQPKPARLPYAVND